METMLADLCKNFRRYITITDYFEVFIECPTSLKAKHKHGQIISTTIQLNS